MRPVSAGTDIGVDLYCESVLGNFPFQHFWVQVKAISKNNIGEDASAWFDFETKHLRYWSRQPVPVYAFLVPVIGWPPETPNYIYGIRLTDKIVKQGIPDRQTIRYRSSEGFAMETLDADLAKFVREIVPYDAATLLVPKGLIAPIEKPEKSIQDSFPMEVVLPHLDSVIASIRFASEISLAEIIESRTRNPRHLEIRRILDKVLRLCIDELNVLGLSSLANSAFMNGEVQLARECLERAKVKLEATDFDPEKKSETLREIEMMLDHLSS